MVCVLCKVKEFKGVEFLDFMIEEFDDFEKDFELL